MAQACVQCPLSASLARNHVKGAVYEDRERNNHLPISQANSSAWDSRGTAGFEAVTCGPVLEQASSLLTEQSRWFETMQDMNARADMRRKVFFQARDMVTRFDSYFC